MKLQYAQLRSHLKKHLAPVYLLNNREAWLQEDARRQIQNASQHAGYQNIVRLAPNSNEGWENVDIILHTLPITQDKRFIELDCRTSIPKNAHTILTRTMKQLTKEHVLCIQVDNIDRNITKQPWYQAIEQHGVIVYLWPLSFKALSTWIQDYASTHVGLKLTNAAAARLAESASGHVSNAYQNIKKLALLYDDPSMHCHIDVDAINPLLNEESNTHIFHFIDCLLTHNLKDTLNQLHLLHENGTECALILWAILREFRLLATIKHDLRSKSTPSQNILEEFSIPKHRQSFVWHYLQTHSIQQLWNTIQQGARIDAMIKNALSGSPWEALEMLIVQCL